MDNSAVGYLVPYHSCPNATSKHDWCCTLVALGGYVEARELHTASTGIRRLSKVIANVVPKTRNEILWPSDTLEGLLRPAEAALNLKKNPPDGFLEFGEVYV